MSTRLLINGICHQCKTSKNNLICCDNLLHPKDSKYCKGKYCDKCLNRHYGTSAQQLQSETSWTCFQCKGVCSCSACRKLRGDMTSYKRRKGLPNPKAGRRVKPRLEEILDRDPVHSLQAPDIEIISQKFPQEMRSYKEVVLAVGNVTPIQSKLALLTEAALAAEEVHKPAGAPVRKMDPPSLQRKPLPLKCERGHECKRELLDLQKKVDFMSQQLAAMREYIFRSNSASHLPQPPQANLLPSVFSQDRSSTPNMLPSLSTIFDTTTQFPIGSRTSLPSLSSTVPIHN